MARKGLAGFGLLAILLLAAPGCRGKYTPVPTRGTVTLDGKPIEGATVQFVAVGEDKEGRMAWGMTDKEGKFQLSTMGHNDGALPREYHVLVVKHAPLKPDAEARARKRVQASGGQLTLDDALFEVYGAGPRTKNVLPEKYGNIDTTPFRVTVPHKGPVVLELTSR